MPQQTVEKTKQKRKNFDFFFFENHFVEQILKLDEKATLWLLSLSLDWDNMICSITN